MLDTTGFGIASVGLSIFDGSHYWDGFAFESTTPVFNATMLSNNLWSYHLDTSGLTDGTVYSLQTQITSRTGTIESPGSGGQLSCK